MASIVGSDGLLPIYAAMAHSKPLPLRVSEETVLVIHVDINQTIVPVDTVQQKGAPDVIAHALAKFMTCKWDDDTNPMSYHDYVFNVAIPGPRSDRALKKQRKERVVQFVDYLEEIDHPFASQTRVTHATALQIIADSSTAERRVVPSFYKLIEVLQREKIRFRIVLRSFGNEVNTVAEELTRNAHIAFRRGSFTAHGFHEVGKEDLMPLGATDTFKLFQQSSWAVQDDWAYWNSREEQFQYGKLFPYHVSEYVHPMFFDDNIFSASSKTNIVCPFDFVPAENGDIDELISKRILVPTDLVASVFDENYFINHVARSLELREDTKTE